LSVKGAIYTECVTDSVKELVGEPAPYAVSGLPSDPLTEREHIEPAHPYRTPFQRDRARIIHSRAFRRLAGKTQVFTHRPSDHFRSRLTHTMEVAQISRAVAGALHLNEDLAEALALVHDIGHPPFGHAGERALDDCLREHGLRFDHNLHALRIVEFFEQRYAAFRGLNLTLGVREGIIKHSRDYTLAAHPELAGYMLDQRPPLEAQLIDWADEIAYITADLDDGFESGILELRHICDHLPLIARSYEAMLKQYPNASEQLLVNETLKRVLGALVDDLITETTRQLRLANIGSLGDVRTLPKRIASFSPAMEAERATAKKYLYQYLYQSEPLEAAHEEAAEVIQSLFRCWIAQPELLPPSCAPDVTFDGVPRTVADYIAGMTDQFILAQFSAYQERC
jgi:dGTPase